jgi:hypothetical protein
MKASVAVFAALFTRTAAFAPTVHSRAFSRNMSAAAVPLANGSMSFDRVCREWRCKYSGDKATSESLEAISKLVDEYLPQVKAVSEGATVNRLICGGCLDFKLMTTVSSFQGFQMAICSYIDRRKYCFCYFVQPMYSQQ